MGPGTNTEVTLVSVRDELERVIKNIALLEGASKPPVVQELVLARRDAESSRMRLGVAQTYEKGFDPWANNGKVDSKETE